MARNSMAKKKYHSGQYEPKNPDKYKGTYPIKWRSTWERKVMELLDNHPDVVAWGSESIKIKYQNPITGKVSNYIPDFHVVYEDKNGNRRQQIIEVKPSSQSSISKAKSRYDKVSYAINEAKWKAAIQWCDNHGLEFRIINENEIFNNPKK